MRKIVSIPVARFPSQNENSVGQSVGKTDKIATEGGHWYLPGGSPFYTISRADGKGERPVTIRDACKVSAVPSVTTITKILKSDALQRYFERQIFDAVLGMEWGGSVDRPIVSPPILLVPFTLQAIWIIRLLLLLREPV